MRQIKFTVSGMQCEGCEAIIETAVSKLTGVETVKADYKSGSVNVSFDPQQTHPDEIIQAIESNGYSVESDSLTSKKPFWLKALFVILAVAALVVVMIAARKLSHQFTVPDLNSHLSDSMIFIVGLITGLHCIGMCGGFVLSYTAKDAEKHRPSWLSHFLYGFGKTLSYAMFGALFGLLGSMVSITLFMQGVTNIAAGLFLILFGLNMLGFNKILKYIHIRQPKRVTHFVQKHNKRSRSPFFIGFFSGFLLGCGPLQAMYVMAAGSSDPIQGAKILTLFGLGTLPALLSFGYLARLFSSTTTRRFFQLSGIILIFVGSMMLNKGLMRTHSGYDFKSIGQRISHSIDSFLQK